MGYESSGYESSARMQVGDPVISGTATRVLYIDSNGNLADSANLTFSTSTNRLSVGTGNGSGTAGFFIGNGSLTTAQITHTNETPSANTYALQADGSGNTGLGGANSVAVYLNNTIKTEWSTTAGAGPVITAGTAANNAPRALFVSQTWTDGTTSNIGAVFNFDMGATGTATGKLMSWQAGVGGVTEVAYLDYLGVGLFSGLRLTTLSDSATAPTLASGGCTNAAMVVNNGTARFEADVGTSCSGSQPLVFTLPAATTGWMCTAQNATNAATSVAAQSSAVSTTSVTITSYSRTTGLAQAWTDGDNVVVSCRGG